MQEKWINVIENFEALFLTFKNFFQSIFSLDFFFFFWIFSKKYVLGKFEAIEGLLVKTAQA